MEVVQSDEFETMAAKYQCLEIARLNEILKNHGIVDVQVREAICKEYAFDSGNFLDQGWFKDDGKTLWPEMCFAERTMDPNNGLGPIEVLYAAEYFSFHECASGDAYWYFTEKNEDASEIENG